VRAELMRRGFALGAGCYGLFSQRCGPNGLRVEIRGGHTLRIRLRSQDRMEKAETLDHAARIISTAEREAKFGTK